MNSISNVEIQIRKLFIFKGKTRKYFKIPEFYFMILAFLGGYSPPASFNLIFIGIIGVLILQIIYKNKLSGILIGLLFFLTNLYFLGALISEFKEFTEFNNKAQQLLFVGLAIWFANLLFSSAMIYKYSPNRLKVNSSRKLTE